MARSTLTPLQRQLRRARLRLSLQTFVDWLVAGWALSLLASAGWFAAQPHLVASAPAPSRWAVAVGALALATAVALVAAVFRQPSPVATALALDERYGLKERVTTSLTLSRAETDTPAAVALLEDVNARVEKIAVRERFPVRLRRRAWLLVPCAATFALVALFYNPAVATPKAKGDERLAADPRAKEEVDRAMQQLQAKAEAKRPEVKDRSPELERLDADLERLSRQPRETKDQAREIIKDLTGIEDQIRKRQQELVQRADSLKEQMKQASRLSKSKKEDGPAKDLNQALERGDLQKARNELDRMAQQLKAEQEADRLRKKLEDKSLSDKERADAQKRLNDLKSKQMSKEDRDRLAKQMKDIKDKVQRLGKSKEEKEKELREQARNGDLDQDQLRRELERLEQDAGRLNDRDMEKLRDVAEKFRKAQQSLEDGNDEQAGRQLEEAADELAQLDREGELQELAEKLEDCEGCKRDMCQGLDDNPVPAAGRRPESKQTVTNSREKRARVQMEKGQLSVVDTAPGDGFKGPRKPAELTEEIRRASQEAPEAIDRQRLPRSASDMARGYFDRLRGDREKKDNP